MSAPAGKPAAKGLRAAKPASAGWAPAMDGLRATVSAYTYEKAFMPASRVLRPFKAERTLLAASASDDAL